MRHSTIPLLTTIAITAGSALLAATPVAANGSVDASAMTTPTGFAMRAFGYGSRARGGDVPTASDRTAFQVIGCTNLAGLDKTNAEATVRPDSDLTLSDARTHVWTSKQGAAVSSWASHDISKVTLVDGARTLFLRGVSSTSHSWHNASGFHTKTSSDIGRIVLDTAGVRTTFPVPAAGDSVNIPGMATITVGEGTADRGAHFATAAIDAVRLHADATDTVTFLAHSNTRIDDGVPTALFSGSSYGTKSKVLEGRGGSGPTPLLVMPCQGTNGNTVKRSISRSQLGGQNSARALTVSQRSDVTGKTAETIERAAVNRADLSGDLRITGVVARAHVTKDTDGYSKDVKGSTSGKVYLDGDRVMIPASGVLRIPGVAKIETNLVNRTKHGIEITAVRVSLLDGSLSVINIAHAKTAITPSGL